VFADRVEIANPGLPPIEVDRCMDDYVSRNEALADLLRRFGV
jgi:ATP-dependent DNA helicase RecG